MSKIVKECPADPIEFLIGKLQVIQRQRKKVMKQVDVAYHKIIVLVPTAMSLAGRQLSFISHNSKACPNRNHPLL